MRRISLLVLSVLLVSMMNAQELRVIKLETPSKSGGKPLMSVLNERKSDREYAADKIKPKDLSNLLWAANGMNRPDGKRTAPSCRNFQEIKVYVVAEEGTYLYDAKAHVLNPLTAGDYREAVAGGQDFVKLAPISIVLVADMTPFGTITEHAKLMASVDIGIVCQNINIACAGLGLATVPRATMNHETLKKVLKLKDTDLLLMNNPVGYPKK